MKPKPDSALTDATPEANALYQRLRAGLGDLGPCEEEEKKTCVHLVRKTAFLGVRFRKDYLILTIKSDRPLESKRCLQTEQLSRNRWYSDIKFTNAADLDPELMDWIKQAYELSG